MFRNPLTDAIVVLIVVLLFFGPKRLPMLSRSLGESLREFRGGLGSRSSEDAEDAGEKPQLQTEHRAAGPSQAQSGSAPQPGASTEPGSAQTGSVPTGSVPQTGSQPVREPARVPDEHDS